MPLWISEFLAVYGTLPAIGAVLVLALGGFSKGVIGFALPLIAISGLGTFLPYEVALALLILPTLVTNVFQSLRNGAAAAWGSFRQYWRLNAILVVMITVSAQLVVALPDRLLFGLLGSLILFFGLVQLFGWTPHLAPRARRMWEVLTALVGGFFGGLSGVWGPPIVMYLLAAGVPKAEMVRAQALCFLTGSLVLTTAHGASGVLNSVTLPMSVLLIVPTVAAMLCGYLVQDRLDQALFRRLTLLALILAGANLLRRAFVA